MKKIEKIKINTDFIKLDQFLKWVGIAESGTDAKNIIFDEKVKVNDEIELRRGRKLYKDYTIEVFEKVYIIE